MGQVCGRRKEVWKEGPCAGGLRSGSRDTTPLPMPMQGPLFDRIVVVDWSAASKPRLGSDSIWIAVLSRHGERGAQRRVADAPGENGEPARVALPRENSAHSPVNAGKAHSNLFRRSRSSTAKALNSHLCADSKQSPLRSHSSQEHPSAGPKRQRTTSRHKPASPLAAVPAGSQGDADPGLTLEVRNIGTRAEAVEVIRRLALGTPAHSDPGGPSQSSTQGSSPDLTPGKHTPDYQRMLVGWDFSLAFPAGFSEALAGGRCTGGAPQASPEQAHGASDAPAAEPLPPWRVPWEYLARHIQDRPDNGNNRFQVAASINKQASGSNTPFWGCPASGASPHLSQKRPPLPPGLREKRVCEELCGAQSTWKLFTAGSVGSQALLGIPWVHSLRFDPRLRAFSRVWPFETGLGLPLAHQQPMDEEPPRAEAAACVPGAPAHGIQDCGQGPGSLGGPEGDRGSGNAVMTPLVVHAEVYPSLVEPVGSPLEPKDARQVRSLALALARLDSQGQLGPLFRGPFAAEGSEGTSASLGTVTPGDGGLDSGLRLRLQELVVEHEGWILGCPVVPEALREACANLPSVALQCGDPE